MVKFLFQKPEVFCKKVSLKNFAKFTEKHLCQSLFLNKFADLRSSILSKKRLWYICFPVSFAKFLRTPFYRTLPVAGSVAKALKFLRIRRVRTSFSYIIFLCKFYSQAVLQVATFC